MLLRTMPTSSIRASLWTLVWKPVNRSIKISVRAGSRLLPYLWNTDLRKISRPALKRFKLPLSLLVPVMAAASTGSPDVQKDLDEADRLFEKKDFSATYNVLLPHKDSNNAHILWRLARSACEWGKMSNKDDRKRLIYEAFAYATKALELDDNNFACHKWYGILLDYTAEYEGTKQRIANAFKCKEHFMKALELNPKDATTMYCLGYWCYLFADMPWYQRKIASVLFASPPTSTYEEALDYFKRGEETDSGFYCKNRLMLGKTYLKMNDKTLAKHWFEQTQKCEVFTEDDKEAIKEATDQLKSL